MSTSAVDHYKTLRANQRLQAAVEEVEESDETVNHWREELDRVQAIYNESLEQKRLCEEAKNAAMESLKEVEKQSEKKPPSPKQDQKVIIDPTTGLPQGEEIGTPEVVEGTEYAMSVMKIRDFMEYGNLVEARELDRKAANILNQLEYKVNPRLLGVDGTFQVNAEEFVKPHTMPEEEDLDRTFEYAMSEPEATDPSAGFRSRFFAAMLGITEKSPYPNGVVKGIMNEIGHHRCLIQKEHEEERATAEQDDGDEEGEDENGDDESEGSVPLEMTHDIWKCIFIAIRNRLSNDREKNTSELQLPREGSAPLARYNPSAHFLFESKQARASISDLDDALVCCKLRSRPSEFFELEKSDSEMRTQLPFEYRTCGDIDGFDADGDLVAMCGDGCYESIRESASYVACWSVPCPTNLDSARLIGDMKDAKKGNSGPWEEDSYKMLIDGTAIRRSKEYFRNCVADANHDAIWASSSRTGTIHAFTTEDGFKDKERCIGLLTFDKTAIKMQKRFVNGRFDIARCGDNLVGSAGTRRLNVWNMKHALEEFPSKLPANSTTNETGPKRQKTEPYKGMQPWLVMVEDEGFITGDVQWMGGSHVVVGPARVDTSSMPMSTSLRLLDLESESVVGLFCGSQQEVAIEKQYCVESDSLLFSTDSSVGFVWDVRNCRPAFMLHTGKLGARILGVPGISSTVAFTFGGSTEEIMCWDLRMPASHVYTMATGNSKVSSLLWHEQTTSLLAATETEHIVKHGRGSGYMYGEQLSEEQEDEACYVDWWPPGAKHEPTYFGSTRWNQREPSVLQYPFDNGKPTGASVAKLKV